VVEADWSAASYWYAMAVLSEQAEIQLPGLRSPSLQGDSRIAALMAPLGVQTIPTPDGVMVVALAGRVPDRSPRLIDFSHTPDLAPTMAVVVAALGLPWRFCGLQSLRIKETDRIAALQQELRTFGGEMLEETPGVFIVKPLAPLAPASAFIRTWEDHRMAMAFAPLSIHGTRIVFDDSAVVAKSYPGFWQELIRAGADVSES
jgi:3-phosphoshikimate 1-carboxyvinyltransferase